MSVVSLEALKARAKEVLPAETLAEMMAGSFEPVVKFADVPDGPELHRILNLTRREIPDERSQEAIDLAKFLTGRLSTSDNPYPGPLRPIQALALGEAWASKGGVGVIQVGAGKTGIAFLLPEVWSAPRPLLVTKAAMVAGMETERRKMAPHWRIRAAHLYPIIAYEKLSAPSSGERCTSDGDILIKSYLERLAPTHIVFDEAHCLRDTGATGTKRVKEYLRAHPETVVWFMTGTLFHESIKDAAHLFDWALKENSPFPRDFQERELWASYLDARKNSAIGKMTGSGAIVKLLTPEEQVDFSTEDENQVDIVRRAVSRRMFETQGVIGSSAQAVDCGLEICSWVPQGWAAGTEELFRTLRGDPEDREAFPGWRLPDGTEIADGMQLSRHLTTAGLGFWSKWDPAPPDEWVFHRNAWSKWCRKAIKYNRRKIDSEALMKDAVLRGVVDDRWDADELELLRLPADLAGQSRLALWTAAMEAERERTGLLEPPSVPVWASYQIVDEVARWISEVQSGVVWVNHIGLGDVLAARLNIPYYQAKGLSSKKARIEAHKGGPAVASIKANGTGKNLQGIWSNNLWLTTPGEQALGRTHRPGQKADVVRNWVYIGCPEHLKAFHTARNMRASFAEQMQNSKEKLRHAITDMVSQTELATLGGLRWACKEEK